jgi:hypothetical protein
LVLALAVAGLGLLLAAKAACLFNSALYLIPSQRSINTFLPPTIRRPDTSKLSDKWNG